MSRSPSPLILTTGSMSTSTSSSTAAAAAAGVSQGNRNPFSIDYILSNAMAKHQQQQQQQPINEAKLKHHINCNQSLITNSTTITPEQNSLIVGHLNSQVMSAQQQLQLQSFQQQQQQQANPNFFYFMACMLIQQQQQQQAARQHHQHRLAPPPPPPPQQPPPPPPQVSSQTTTSPIDSLSLLARLTGSSNGIEGQQQHKRSTGGGVQRSHTSRRQPYPTQLARFSHNSNFSNAHTIGGGSLPAAGGMFADLRNQVIRHNTTQQSKISSIKPIAYNQQFHKIPLPVAPPPPPPPPPTHQVTANHNQSNGNNSTNGEKLDNMKPAHSYIGLIGMCVLSSPDKRMVLNDIYQHILDHYPYYRNRGSGWRNSVRHNLSLNECFQKAGRAANGKGHYWTIHPANMEDFMNGDFRRRRAQRKVRRYNNMDVPSDESDDESMEDTATRPPLPEHFKRSIEMHKQLTSSASSLACAAADSSSRCQLPVANNDNSEFIMARVAAMAAAVQQKPQPAGGLCLNLCPQASNGRHNHQQIYALSPSSPPN